MSFGVQPKSNRPSLSREHLTIDGYLRGLKRVKGLGFRVLVMVKSLIIVATIVLRCPAACFCWPMFCRSSALRKNHSDAIVHLCATTAHTVLASIDLETAVRAAIKILALILLPS